MALSEHRPKVFISHSWMDKRLAVEIRDGIKDFANVWIDFENMNPGGLIDEGIEKELKMMDFILLIWTRNVIENKNVQNEIKWAKNFQIPIIQCYFEFDEKGEIIPKHEKKTEESFGVDFNNILGIEFRKLHHGLIRLINTFQNVTFSRLPEEIKQEFSAKFHTIKTIEQLNTYLVNYRNIKNTKDDRKFWINKIIAILGDLIDSGEDNELIKENLFSFYELENSDPEGFNMIKSWLDRYFDQPHPTAQRYQYLIPLSVIHPFQNPVLESLRKNFLGMLQKETTSSTSYQLLTNNFPHLTQNQIIESIQVIINISGDGINLLNQAYILAQQAGLSNEFNPILNYVLEYFFEVEDIRSDNIGPLGWVDDSYLCFSSLQQINHVYYSLFQKWLINVDLNPCVHYLIQSLNQNELYQLDNLLKAKFSSINWNNLLIRMGGYAMYNLVFGQNFVNQNYGGSSWGGSWEDQMAERAARLGISINF